MVNKEFSVALAALAIAIVALAIALGQLLSQVFSTAEGYRRCQRSVMGPWFKRTRLRFRWSQFRFETLVTTPELVLAQYPLSGCVRSIPVAPARRAGRKDRPVLPTNENYVPPDPYSPLNAPSSLEQVSIIGDPNSIGRTLLPRESKADPTNELVCWIALLRSLHYNAKSVLDQVPKDMKQKWEAYLREISEQTSWPAVRFKERSWDFMPPDVVRPFASSTVSEIAIMARRMGMIWKDFRPTEGIMKAEGGFHVLSSTEVRGLGTLLQYRHIGGGATDADPDTEATSSKRRRLFGDETDMTSESSYHVWTADADRMWFGILPGNPDLGLPDFTIGSSEEAYAVMDRIDKNAGVELRSLDKNFLHGFCDIIPMVAPWMRQRGSRINQVPKPTSYARGLTYYHGGYRTFESRLKKYIEHNSDSTHAKWVLEQYTYLQTKHKHEWDGISPDVHKRPLEFFDDLEKLYYETTDYFKSLQNRDIKPLPYLDLVRAHLSKAPFSYKAALRVPRDRLRGPRTFDDRRHWRGEAMHFYWDYMGDYVKLMNENGCDNKKEVEEAWITLIFRAMCWQRAHVFIDDSLPLPSKYYSSKLPVYIG